MMKNGLLHEANEVLHDLNRKHARMVNQHSSLMKYDGWVLSMESSKKGTDHVYYDVMHKDLSKKSYLGNEKNEHVLNVKRFRYAQKAISVLENDILLLDALVKGYMVPDYETINNLLPATYQTNLKSPNSPSAGKPKEALEWEEKLKKEKAKYPPYKPEQLKHPALDGTMMRSKSEVIIANILFLAGILYVYEAPIFINGEMVLPDFRILSLIDLKSEIIIEHQGMIFVDDYADKFIKSLKLYLQSDWIPNQNLFFTFDNARETLDPQQIMTILRKFIDPSI